MFIGEVNNQFRRAAKLVSRVDTPGNLNTHLFEAYVTKRPVRCSKKRAGLKLVQWAA